MKKDWRADSLEHDYIARMDEGMFDVSEKGHEY